MSEILFLYVPLTTLIYILNWTGRQVGTVTPYNREATRNSCNHTYCPLNQIFSLNNKVLIPTIIHKTQYQKRYYRILKYLGTYLTYNLYEQTDSSWDLTGATCRPKACRFLIIYSLQKIKHFKLYLLVKKEQFKNPQFYY